MTKTIITSGGFDNLRSNQVRFLHENSKFGKVILLLFSDGLIESIVGTAPKFPLSERQYYLQSIRFVNHVHVIKDMDQLKNISNIVSDKVDSWFVLPSEELPDVKKHAEAQGIEYQRIASEQLAGFPEIELGPESSLRKKVIVTGCFDWFHSGHVRFFEEACDYGELYVVVGNDKNIELLKGPGHPMFSQDERRYMAAAIRFVRQALVSSGQGWLDAEEEIQKIKPDIYLVNEDGDQEIKREYCESHGIEYVVLKRFPKPGLEPRISTDLRGF
jgi:cytidyltransferase-like protein